MKRNFAAQPEVVEVITPLDMISEINPKILNSEDIFVPNPLQNFYSDAPNKNNYRAFNDNGSTPWWQYGIDFVNTGIEAWSQSEKNKAEVEQANKAQEIANIQLQIEQEQLKQQELKSENFRKYGLPLIVGSVLLAFTITTIIIIRKK